MKRATLCLLAFIVLSTLVVGLPPSSRDVKAQGATIGRVRTGYKPPVDERLYFLVIGSDARSGNPEQGSSGGPDINADGIHIVALNTRTMRGGILNFPRDSWVPIPGHGMGRMNDALDTGGPQLLARTVEQTTGISLDYWIMTGFEGFQGAIQDLGGVEMDVPTAVNDPGGSGAALRPGRQRLAGYQALAYMRARKPFSDGDVTRTTNHGRLLLALQRKLRQEIASRPAALLRWLAVAERHTKFDIPPEELFTLALVVSEVRPNRVRNVTVPVSLGTVGAAEVVFISGGANRLYNQLRRRASFGGG